MVILHDDRWQAEEPFAASDVAFEVFSRSEFLAREDADGSEPDNLQVEHHRAMGHVVEVHLQSAQHLFYRVGVAVIERCHGEDARAYGIELGVARVVLHNLVDEELPFGSWSDKRHVADEDVPQLRELVEMMVAQETSYARQSVVVLFAEVRVVVVFGMRHHRAELIELEGPSFIADALLAVDGRSAVFEAHTKIDDCHGNGKHQHGEC